MEITLSKTLPPYPTFVEGIRRAPDRGYTLDPAQTATALKNALRYIPEELHETLAPELHCNIFYFLGSTKVESFLLYRKMLVKQWGTRSKKHHKITPHKNHPTIIMSYQKNATTGVFQFNFIFKI